MKSVLGKIGLALIITGVLTLILGIIMAVTVGTYLVSVFIFSSMVMNTLGIVLLQYGGK